MRGLPGRGGDGPERQDDKAVQPEKREVQEGLELRGSEVVLNFLTFAA